MDGHSFRLGEMDICMYLYLRICIIDVCTMYVFGKSVSFLTEMIWCMLKYGAGNGFWRADMQREYSPLATMKKANALFTETRTHSNTILCSSSYIRGLHVSSC